MFVVLRVCMFVCDGSDCLFVYFVTFYETEWMDQIAGAEEPDIGLSLPSVCLWTEHTPFVIPA